MSLIKRTPQSPTPFQQMEQEFGALMDRLFGRDEWLSPNLSEDVSQAIWRPKVDIHEDANHYYLDAELPGLSKDDLKVRVQDGLLVLEGELKRETQQEGTTYHRVERRYGAFYRSFRLPERVQADAIAANFADGVLHLVVPKAEDAKPKHIEVRVK